MWIFLNNAALSIVAHRTKPETLVVRSRVAGDIEAVFPTAAVTNTPSADYAYRANVARTAVAKTLAANILAIDYPNFKNSIRDDARHTVYFGVYNAALRLASLNAPPMPRLSAERVRRHPGWSITEMPGQPRLFGEQYYYDDDEAGYDDCLAEDVYDPDLLTHARPFDFFRS